MEPRRAVDVPPLNVRDEGRLALLPGPLVCDARRWQKHGALRQTLRNFCLRAAESLGVHPDRLAELYLDHWKRRGK